MLDVKIVVALIGFAATIIGSLIKPTTEWVKEWRKKRKYNLDKIVNYEMKVYQLINQIKKDYKADRVCIAKLHNGGSFVDGLPMQKFSITNEVYSSKTKAIMQRYQQVPLGSFAPMMMDLVYHGEVKPVPNKIDHETKRYSTPCTYYIVIRGDKEMPLGYLSVGFKDESRKLTDSERNELKKVTTSLFALLITSFKE